MSLRPVAALGPHAACVQIYDYAGSGAHITSMIKNAKPGCEQLFNNQVSSHRISVEHPFGAYCRNFQLFKAKAHCCRILQSNVHHFFIVGVLLYNIHSCLYRNQVSLRYDCQPPELTEYLADARAL